MIAPQELDTFLKMPALERAAMCRDYLAYLEQVVNDTKAHLEIALREAYENGEESDEYYVQVKYKSGTALSPDAKLLEAKFPIKFRAWYQAELNAFQPKLTKKAVEALWKVEGDTPAEKKASRQRNAEEMATIMVEHPVKTQYALANVADRGKWTKEADE